jgi:hypothetical protein
MMNFLPLTAATLHVPPPGYAWFFLNEYAYAFILNKNARQR